MRMRRWVCMAAALGLPLAAACSENARGRLARVFFDVPSAATDEAGAAAFTSVGVERRVRRPTHGLSQAWVSPASFASKHPPFLQRHCATCHDESRAQQPRTNYLDVCRECHADVFVATPFSHGPFAAGACHQCHRPHASQFEILFVRPEPALCTDCHEMAHKPICSGRRAGVAAPCTACHEPHGADNANFLRAGDEWRRLLEGHAAASAPLKAAQ